MWCGEIKGRTAKEGVCNMYVCVYVCMYVYVYICVYVCMYMYVYMYVCVFVCTHVFVCVCYRQLQATQEEIRLHRYLIHKNIVRYYGAFVEDDRLKIFMEYVPGGVYVYVCVCVCVCVCVRVCVCTRVLVCVCNY